MEKERKIYEARLAKEKGEAETVAASFAGVELLFKRKVHGDGEELYGSVSPSDVTEALEQRGLSAEKRKISLSEPIKSLGKYTASIKLHPEVTVSFPVTVEKDEQEEKVDEEKKEKKEET